MKVTKSLLSPFCVNLLGVGAVFKRNTGAFVYMKTREEYDIAFNAVCLNTGEYCIVPVHDECFVVEAELIIK